MPIEDRERPEDRSGSKLFDAYARAASRLRRGRLDPKSGPRSGLRGGGYPATWANRPFILPTASTRKVHVAGITCQPDEAWMRNMARHLTDGFDGFLLGKRYLILDRDPLFTRSFRAILRGSGVEPLRLPAKSPNLNAYAERFVLSIESECLDKIVPLGERHLRHAIREYVEHYHHERHHQGLDSSIITPQDPPATDGPIRCRERVGGILNHYYREAA